MTGISTDSHAWKINTMGNIMRQLLQLHVISFLFKTKWRTEIAI